MLQFQLRYGNLFIVIAVNPEQGQSGCWIGKTHVIGNGIRMRGLAWGPKFGLAREWYHVLPEDME